MITLYSTHCPRCRVIELKLQKKKIDYQIIDDEKKMEAEHIKTAPCLKLSTGELLEFSQANKWIDEQVAKE